MKSLMKNLIAVTVSMTSLAVNADVVYDVTLGRTSLNGYATYLTYMTNRNTFEDESSDNGTHKFKAGVVINHTFNEYFRAALYSTTDAPFDYGFVEGSYAIDGKTAIGARLGRNNIISGPFAGLGPYSDEINFLPQGTEPNRIGTTFYRFDGIQLYLDTYIGDVLDLYVEALYGEQVIDNEKGLFEPAFFAILEEDSLHADHSKPAKLININLYAHDVEFTINYGEVVGNIEGVYKNTLPADLVTGNPALAGQVIDVELPYQDDNYPSRFLKLGLSYNLEDWEFLVIYFSQKDTPVSDPSSPFDLGTNFVSDGFTYMARHSFNNRTVLYGGYSDFEGSFGNNEVDKALKVAPSWVDTGRSVFTGVRYLPAESISLILEGHYFKGGIFLNGDYQDPVTTHYSWALVSFSASYIF